MGGERSSAVRARLAGRVCCLCRNPLPPPHVPGERCCERCLTVKTAKRKVYLHFMWRAGWYCQFLEEDLRTSLPRKLVLRDPAKLFELAERGGVVMTVENRQALEYAIANGRGSLWLELTPDQYAKLRESKGQNQQ
jgi:hypothetical protein